MVCTYLLCKDKNSPVCASRRLIRKTFHNTETKGAIIIKLYDITTGFILILNKQQFRTNLTNIRFVSCLS